jgi:upstream activation factor subunit UAF30
MPLGSHLDRTTTLTWVNAVALYPFLLLCISVVHLNNSMASDISALRPKIWQILSAPGTDLKTISAKRVRRQLLELDPALTAEFMKENKVAVDLLIGTVFEKVQAEKRGESEGEDEAETKHSAPGRKKKPEGDDDTEEDATSSSPLPRKLKKAKKSSRELTDAELARQLSSEINSRSRRSVNLRNSNGSPRKAHRKTKSSELVDTDGENSGEGEGHSRTRTKRKSGGGAKGGFAKEYILRYAFYSLFSVRFLHRNLVLNVRFVPHRSGPLAVVVGADKLSRPQVVKQLWVYIKDKELQNPKNRREILCDPNFRAIFNADKVDMFKMNKILGQYVYLAPL